MKYQILASFNTEAVFQPQKRILNELNKTMSEFGFTERISLRTEDCPVALLSAKRELTIAELDEICETYRQEWEKRFPGSDARICIRWQNQW